MDRQSRVVGTRWRRLERTDIGNRLAPLLLPADDAARHGPTPQRRIPRNAHGLPTVTEAISQFHPPSHVDAAELTPCITALAWHHHVGRALPFRLQFSFRHLSPSAISTPHHPPNPSPPDPSPASSPPGRIVSFVLDSTRLREKRPTDTPRWCIRGGILLPPTAPASTSLATPRESRRIAIDHDPEPPEPPAARLSHFTAHGFPVLT